MLFIRFLLIGLASLNCAWALSHALTEYMLFLIQSLDPFYHSAPPDSTTLLAWLIIAAASGSGAFVLFRTSYKERLHAAKIITIAVPTQPTEQTPDVAA